MVGTIVRFFQDGGPFMYPILFVFAFGVAIAIERWMYLTLSGASNRSLWKKDRPVPEGRQLPGSGAAHGQVQSGHRLDSYLWPVSR